MNDRQFDFGQNWLEFSEKALTEEKVEQAKIHFQSLTKGMKLKGKTFLDIGFGQGLSLLSACESGALCFGNDINVKCKDVLNRNKDRFFHSLKKKEIPVLVQSILEESAVDAIKNLAKQKNGFDVVHSWGVLHHTGNMERAFYHACSLVKPGGYFIVAIYNRHFTSFVWLLIKWMYNHVPNFVKKLMIQIFIPVIHLAKRIVTGKNPNTKTRGMDFYYDVIDWVGGYPYEYASISEIEEIVRPLGFKLVRSISAEVPTGCNEMIFQKV